MNDKREDNLIFETYLKEDEPIQRATQLLKEIAQSRAASEMGDANYDDLYMEVSNILDEMHQTLGGPDNIILGPIVNGIIQVLQREAGEAANTLEREGTEYQWQLEQIIAILKQFEQQ